MRTMIRRAATLALAVALMISVASCAAYGDLVKGFADTAAYMQGEENIRAETKVTISLSENAKPVSFTQFVNTAVKAAEEEDETALLGIEIGLMMIAEIYEGRAFAKLGWVGEGGLIDTLLTIVIIDETAFISTEILKYAGKINALAQYVPMLNMIRYDYITVEYDYLCELLNSEFADKADIEDIPDFSALEPILRAAMTAFTDVMRDYTPKVITKDIIKKEKDVYTLALDAEASIQIIGEILNIAAQNEEAIKEFLFDIITEAGAIIETDKDLDAAFSPLGDADFTELAAKAGDKINSLIIGDDIPDFEMTFAISGVGRGADKKQTAAMSIFADDLSKFGAPFDVLSVDVSSVHTIAKDKIIAPSGSTIPLSDLVAMVGMMQANGMGGLRA